MRNSELAASHENPYREQLEVIREVESKTLEWFRQSTIAELVKADQADEQLASLTKGGVYRLSPVLRQSIDKILDTAMIQRNDQLYTAGFAAYISHEGEAAKMAQQLQKLIEPSIQYALLVSFETRARQAKFTDNSRRNIERFPVQSNNTLNDSVQRWMDRTNQICHEAKLYHEVDPYAEVFWRLGIQRDGDQMRQDLYDDKIKALYACRQGAQDERARDRIDNVFAYAHGSEALNLFRGAKTFNQEVVHDKLALLHDIRPTHLSGRKVVVTAGIAALATGTLTTPAMAEANSPLNIPGVGEKTSLTLPVFEIKSDNDTAKKAANTNLDNEVSLEVPAVSLQSDMSAVQTLDTSVLSLEVPDQAIVSDKTVVNDLNSVKHAPRTELDDIRARLKAVPGSNGPQRLSKEMSEGASVKVAPLEKQNPVLSNQLSNQAREYHETLSRLPAGHPAQANAGLVLARLQAAIENPASLSDISDNEYVLLMQGYEADFAPFMELRQQTIIKRYDTVEFGKWKGLGVEGRQKLAAVMAYLELAGTPQEEIQRRLDEIAADRAKAEAEAKARAEAKAKAEAAAERNSPKVEYKKPSASEVAKAERAVYEKTIRDRIHDLTRQTESVPGSMFDPVDPDWLTDEILKADKTYAHDPLITPEFVIAQLYQESKFDPNIGSSAGALGIAQFMSGTASEYGLGDRTDPAASIKAYYAMMDKMIKQARRDYPNQDPIHIALASYNAGPGAVAQYGGVPNFTETKNYVSSISKISNKTEGLVDKAVDNHKDEVRKEEKAAKQAEKRAKAARQQAEKRAKAEARAKQQEQEQDGNDCAPGSRSLGQVATSEHPGGTEVCAILNLPSTGEESTPGSSYYVTGAEGKSIVEAQYSKNLVDMVDAARKDGVVLRANSSLRTNEHQAALWVQLGQNRNVVAPPGGSLHEKGNAIDFTMRNGISQQFCVWDSGVCEQPGDPAWEWLSKNAPKFGFYQYSQEYWHFDPTKH